MTDPTDETPITDNGIEPAMAAETEADAAPSLMEEPFAPANLPVVSTPEELQALQQKAAKADENYDLYLRTRAEIDNFRRRVARDRQEAVRFASQGLIEKLLPVLDNFEMAMAAANAPGQAGLDALRQGIAMVQGQLRSVLSEAGVQEVDAAGQAFDPNHHEAVSQIESADVPEGHVLQQIRKGYRLHDRLIRAASVVVAKAPGA